MRTPTIWESASRPLFIRSVWLESTREGRGTQHRHFILDYETAEQLQQKHQLTRSAVSPARRRLREEDTLQHSVSCDFSDFSATPMCDEVSTEDLLLVGSAKLRLHQQPIQQQNRQQLKLLKFYRRPSFTTHSRKHVAAQYDYQLNRRMRELQELYSRHSSLQDMQSTLSNACSNPEERLAERVLNWLDLAGKSEHMKNYDIETPMDIMEAENLPTNQYVNEAQRLQQHASTALATKAMAAPSMTTKRKQCMTTQRRHCINNSNAAPPIQGGSGRRRHTDAVKPITIIFNREGFPVRLNRAARNIDLCALASSAGTTRRLAGTLASTRLYKGSETMSYKVRTLRTSVAAAAAGAVMAKTASAHQQPQVTTARSAMRQRNMDAEKQMQPTQKRLHEDFVGHSAHDARRQLHIFMPSLPKKSVLGGGNCGTDDASVSLLSHTFNERCKM